MATVREEIFNTFRAFGMTTMFGNPGSTELPFLHGFPNDIRYILALQESVVVAMATAYALVSDNAALVNVHTTAGMGNAMGAIVNAAKAKAPLVITAGQQDRGQIRTEPYLWGKQVEFARTYCKWSTEPHRSVDVPEAIARAYHTAMTEPRGPVFVSICMDGMDDPCPPIVPRRVSYRTAPIRTEVELAAQIVNRGERIAIVAGEGVDAQGAWADTVKLAEALQAGVFQSPEAYRYSFPQNHPLFQGHLPAAMEPIAEKLKAYDTVIVLGATVFLYYPYVPGPVIKDGTQVVQFTEDPSEAARSLVGMSVIGNVAESVKLLLELLKPIQREAPPRWEPLPTAPKTPMPPEYIYSVLAEVMPERVILCDEAPSSRPIFQRQFRLKEQHSLFATASGGLGFAMPAAVGAALACPERPVVCLIGDGSAQYAIQALYTAAQCKLPITFIIMNNAEYGILKAFCDFTHVTGVPGLDLPGADFEGIAKGYGLGYRRVKTPETLKGDLADAFKSQQPSIVEIIYDSSIPPLL